MSFTAVPLTLYANLHPSHCLCIRVNDITQDAEIARAEDPRGMKFHHSVTFNAIAVYSRARDARRALKALGYTQEGNVWRRTPKAEQSLTPIAQEILDHGH